MFKILVLASEISTLHELQNLSSDLTQVTFVALKSDMASEALRDLSLNPFEDHFVWTQNHVFKLSEKNQSLFNFNSFLKVTSDTQVHRELREKVKPVLFELWKHIQRPMDLQQIKKLDQINNIHDEMKDVFQFLSQKRVSQEGLGTSHSPRGQSHLKSLQFSDPMSVQSQIKTLASQEIVDLKYSKDQNNIQLELKNLGVTSFDHLIVENSIETYQWLKNKDKSFIQSQNDHLEFLYWESFRFQASGALPEKDTWFIYSEDLNVTFDNLFLIHRAKSDVIVVWAQIPFSQSQNNVFYEEFQNRIKKAIENKWLYVTLNLLFQKSSQRLFQDPIEIFKKSHPRLSYLPSFKNKNQNDKEILVLNLFKEIIKKHQLKRKKE